MWVIAICFFGLGDALTTGIGLGLTGVFEANPLLRPLGRDAALLAMAGTKTAILAGSYLVWTRTADPYRTGIPLGLAALGVAVTSWNLQVLVRAVLG